jgi:MFS family permease
MPRLLAKIGYRWVLISNTIILGFLLMAFSMIGLGTPIWVIVLLAFCYGGFTSLQYSSMNTLVYADTTDQETSAASTIASTMQQMSISFGVAVAGLATAFYVPARAQSSPLEMIGGVHKALMAMGVLTIASTAVFRSLKDDDGEQVSHQKVLHHPGV